MKKYINIIAISAAVGALASCDLNKTPVFSDADSFAAFESTSYSVNEDCGQLVIPVTIASVDPVKTTVSYELVADSAKEGSDYTLEDDSAVLVFDGETRTQNIVINIVNRPDEYTKDLTFSVKLLTAKGINLGASQECSVKILDLDHPLGKILGSYTVVAQSYWSGALQYVGQILKDDNDETACYVLGLGDDPFNTEEFAVPGKVSSDLNTITITLPVTYSYSSSYNLNIVPFNGVRYFTSGDVTLTRDENGNYTSDSGVGFQALYVSSGSAAGFFDLIMPGIVFYKN